jgi:circadian clock protein KaiC
MSFEENVSELASDVASLGYDLPTLIESDQLAVDYVRVERQEIEENGEYDLEGLFVRLNHAIKTVGAKRVVLDTIESLFAGLSNEALLRAELRRLFRWLKEREVTAVITGERGDGTLTRHGLEEYVSDAVILLDHRIEESISTRRLRVVKYRGSHHGTNEYPFLIDRDGIMVLPVTSLGLTHQATEARISTGIPELDRMLGGAGLYRGSTALISGTAGSGKTSVAAHFVDAACARGERCLWLLLEESPSQVIRNMRSIGIDLAPWVERGLLRFAADRPSRYGLESHLASLHRAVRNTQPSVVVIDPITTLLQIGTQSEVRTMLTRVIDYLKTAGITTFFTSLTSRHAQEQENLTGISSLMDAWLLLTLTEFGQDRRRALSVLKSRGMPHSTRIHEFVFTDRGIHLMDSASVDQTPVTA